VLFKFLPVISSKKEHPYGNNSKKHKDISGLPIGIPIRKNPIQRKEGNSHIQVFGIS